MAEYTVRVDIERPEEIPDLDELQARGVGSLLSEWLDRIGEILGPDGELVVLDDYRIGTYPQGALIGLDLDAPNLKTAEQAARAIVDDVLEETEILAEWEVTSCEAQMREAEVREGLAAADTDDAPSSDLAERAASMAAPEPVIVELSDEEIERFRQRVASCAPQLRAFDLSSFGYWPDEDDDEEPVGVPRDIAELAAGALIYCTTLLMDELFQDLETLHEDDGRTVADAGDAFFNLNDLPPQYATRYTELFVKKFIVATAAITGRLTAEQWEPPACVAEELALRLLIRQVEPTLDMYGLYDDDIESAYAAFYDSAFDDVDHELLYEPAMDGIDEDPDIAPYLRMAPMGFAHWFVPFNGERYIHPYAQDGRPARQDPVHHTPRL